MKDSSAVFNARSLLLLVICLGAALNAHRGNAYGQTSPTPNSPGFTLKTSVNRVLVDVTVTDAHGNPVHGLTKNDFTVEEDGKPQTVLSFDAYNFDKGMDYVPPKLPAMQPNTFVNLPASPERGPLYVLFYDLVNIPIGEQAYARAQLVKFIENKPAGARFAIFVASDGVHLVQGFTSDERKLLAAVDPKSSRPHVPEIFLMGVNFGEGEKLTATARLSEIARYLAPMPGRKNLIWFASEFPLSLFPGTDEPQAFQQQAKKTVDLLANNQIAVYPVDVSGVVVAEAYAPPGDAGGAGITNDIRQRGPNASHQIASPGQGGAGPGVSLLYESYWTQDEIAQITGGKAVYSSNDLVGALEKVTENGGSYYTLAYSPSNKNFDGHLRHILVRLKEGNYHLAYRRAYYGAQEQGANGTADDAIEAVMEHGAPEDRQLIFGVHAAAKGAPRRGSQVYTIDYTVMARQLRAAGDTTPELEIAAAIYGADGRLLSSTVNKAMEAGSPAAKQTAYRMEIQLDAPLNAKFMRFAVRDPRTGKSGAMEITLPLAPTS